MKIIATTKDGYLAEITGGEVANLLGYDSTYDDGFRTVIRNQINQDLAGFVIEVEKIYETAKMLRGLNRADIAQARKTLKYTQEKIDELQDIVDKLTLFETIKEY